MPAFRKGAAGPVETGTVLAADDVDRFRSSTARLTAAVPFQVLSDGDLVYVFRQSVAADDTESNVFADGAALVDGTLLVDRFVLSGTGVGADPELTPKREARFQRSRSRTRPDGPKDTLGAEDLDHRPFVEPTQALRFRRA